jgi:putative oxidoreductase
MNAAWSKYAPLPLRIIIGIGFIYHGFPKLFDGGHRLGFTGMVENIGVPAAGLAAWVVGLVEFFGGLMLIAGAFVAVVTALQIIIMLVALFGVHLSNGFNFMHVIGQTDTGPVFGMPGYEVNLLYIAALLALLLLGPSQWSVDKALAQKKGGAGLA